MPVVHVAWGVDPFTGRLRVARGLIAVGPVALGLVAVGPLAVGLVAVGQVVAGLSLAVGQIAAGLGAFGQLAVGSIVAGGQVAAARQAFGEIVWSGGWAQVGLAGAWLAAATLLALAWWRGGRNITRLLGARQQIGAARPGIALLQGRILPLSTVEAPVSRRACVAYDVRRVRAGRAVINAERACQDFVVDDGTGRARVLGEDAILLLEPLSHVAVEQRVVAQKQAAGGAPGGEGGLVRGVGTAFERVLLPGDQVRVAGHVLCSLGASGPAEVALQSGAAGPVLVTNRDVDEVRAEAQLWLVFAVVLFGSALAAVAAVAL